MRSITSICAIAACLAGIAVSRPARAADQPLPIIDPSMITDPLTGVSQQKRDEGLVAALKADIADLSKTDPQAALAKCQKFFDEHPDMHPTVQAELVLTVASLYYPALKDPKNALATYDWLLKKFPKYPLHSVVEARADLLFHAMDDQAGALASLDADVKAYSDAQDTVVPMGDEAKLLAEANRPADAEALLKAWLPRIVHARPSFGLDALKQYVALVEKAGRLDDAQKALAEALVCNSVYLDPPSQNEEWVMAEIGNLSLKQNQPQDQVRWAKLRFMACAYSGGSIVGASRALTAAWKETDPAGKELQAFAAAQTDPTAHNPLSDVTLPVVDPGLITGEMAKAAGDQKIGLEILCGDLKAAMADAKAMQADTPTATAGAAQVCRVLKAADLNLLSAAQYLRFLRGQGTDPTLRLAK